MSCEEHQNPAARSKICSDHQGTECGCGDTPRCPHRDKGGAECNTPLVNLGGVLVCPYEIDHEFGLE
jgi:hypothetical protein